MQTLTQQLVSAGLGNRVLTEAQLARIVTGTRQRRYHLVNRATRAGEIHRLRRGLYVLDAKLRDNAVHPFALAQALAPGSYVSLETALAHHGWIPETVHVTASIAPGRKSLEVQHAVYGSFSFHPLAIQKGYFLELVERLQHDRQSMFVARPIRALLDLVCLRKIEWQGPGWMIEGLRIDPDNLRSVTAADIGSLRPVYKQKRANAFLKALAKELALD